MRRVVALLALLAIAGSAAGHAFRPSLLELRELDQGRVEVVWRPGSEAGEALAPLLPERCHPVAAAAGPEVPERFVVDCGAAGLAGATVGVRGFSLRGEDALLRVELRDGRALSAALRAASPSLAIAALPSPRHALASYFALGVEHILLGADHLLFVFALVLLVPARRRLLLAVTAFTAAHSLTLALASLSLARLPPRPVEAAIALSLVLLALELARRDGHPALGRPWAVAFGFGLLHGFGFAGALAELGLPPTAIPLALLGFNLGVEAGQLAFIAGALLVLALLRRAGAPLPRRVAGYAIGVLATWWTLERVAAFWG
jgi:hydrogenase/urease accessory protein HupE